ncbi:MAG: hypothetical protein GQ574_13290 [Crocinitomix sp.]|nr:hypothetical protein [Crocinitomix sp.]
MNFYGLIFCLAFITACSATIDESPDTIDGTWKIVKTENEFVMASDLLYDGVQLSEVQPWDADHWIIFNDTILESKYPYYAKSFRQFKLVSAEEFDSIRYNIMESYNTYTKRFSGDTLIMKRRTPKYYESYYMLKQDVDPNQVALLKVAEVDWSHYRKNWIYDHFTESSGMKCPRNFPQIIDLTEKNSDNYEFEKNILKYMENDSLHRFEFSSGYDGELNLLHACDSGCQGMWLEYQDMSQLFRCY